MEEFREVKIGTYDALTTGAKTKEGIPNRDTQPKIVSDFLKWVDTTESFIVNQRKMFSWYLSNVGVIAQSKRSNEIRSAMKTMFSMFDTNAQSAVKWRDRIYSEVFGDDAPEVLSRQQGNVPLQQRLQDSLTDETFRKMVQEMGYDMEKIRRSIPKELRIQ